MNVEIGGSKIRLGEPTHIKIDSTEAGYGDLECKILDHLGREMDILRDQNDLGKWENNMLTKTSRGATDQV